MTTVAGSEGCVAPPGPPEIEGSIHERISALARANPTTVAVRDGRTALTYGELDHQARRLSDRIRRHTAVPGSLTAVALDQGAEAVTALLAVLRAGGCYTLLDLTVPPARLHEVVGLARPRLVLSDAAHADLAGGLAAHASSPLVLVDDEDGPDGPSPGPGPRVSPGDPANVVFTSGSTGRPKGVIVPHGAYLDHARAAAVSMDFRPDDRLALVLPLGFAAAALALHRALAAGAEVHLYDPRVEGIEGLAPWMRERRISYVDMTPTLLRAFVATLGEGEGLPDLRVVTTAGEAVFGADAAALSGRLAPGSRFINHAGSSETSGYAVFAVRLDGPVPEGQLPSGTVLGDRTLTIVADDGTEVEGEGEGELVVTSRHVALGYWGQPELTAERFTESGDGRRTFRTGDRCYRRADGVVEHRGRLDQMVKIRGYLVEPTEVEAALLASGEVSSAVVVGVAPPGQSATLVSYVVPAHRTTSAASVRRTLRERLPSYMVPGVVVLVDEIPRNANGKVDRQALKDLPLPTPGAPVPPRDPVEFRLAVTWADLLGLDAIGVEDDFFELGGDSLAAEAAMAAVTEEFGVTLPTSVLLEAPTVAELAAQVRAPGAVGASSTVVPLRTTGSRPPLFIVAGVGGFSPTYLPLSLCLGAEQPVYVIQNPALERRALPDRSVTSAARRALRAVVEVAPTGPVLLAGHSWGGIVAAELARQLTDRGRHVAMVALLDVLDPRYPHFDDPVDAPGPTEAPAGEAGATPGRWPRTSRLVGRCRQLGVVVRSGAAALSGAPRTPAKIDLFARHSMILARRHRFRPWGGRATVVMGDDRRDNRVFLQWDGILEGEVCVVSVPGGHESLLRDPHARALASALDRSIAAATSPSWSPADGG